MVPAKTRRFPSELEPKQPTEDTPVPEGTPGQLHQQLPWSKSRLPDEGCCSLRGNPPGSHQLGSSCPLSCHPLFPPGPPLSRRPCPLPSPPPTSATSWRCWSTASQEGLFSLRGSRSPVGPHPTSSALWPSPRTLPTLPRGPPSTAPLRLPGPQPPKWSSPPLFTQSRSSSPLHLNLLQEELPPETPRQTPGEAAVAETGCLGGAKIRALRREGEEEEEGEDGGHPDGHSVSSELFDLLLLEDSQSGTCSGSASAASVSLASASNGSSSNGTSGCGAGSQNSSPYFTSNDSSEVSKRGRKQEEEKGPPWPARMKEEVLREDLAQLAAMEKHQPRFSEEQKEELAQVHPWIRTRTLPQEIDTQGCPTCDSTNASGQAAGPEDGSPPESDAGDHLVCGMLPLPPRAWP